MKEAMLYSRLDEKYVQCYLCAHNCKISDAGFGACGVRKNIEGKLFSLVYGEAAALHIDPIEKKPLYHFFPGSDSFSIATLGCNFRCGFCQNWQISQVSLKDKSFSMTNRLMPEDIVIRAKAGNCLSISYTYTEPTIFFEYAYDTAKLADQEGIYNNFVSNGYISREALDKISPYLDAANVDLKAFSADFYKNICKASLSPVLDSIAYMKELGIWVEITTLIIPGKNDSEEELAALSKFIAGLDKNIPWHISRFHPNYKFINCESTPKETLNRAKAIGEEHGLRYIYLGNVIEGADTHCYNCGKCLIKRLYFDIQEYNIKDGKCPSCGTVIAGRWSKG